MATGKKVEDRGHIVGFKEEIAKVALSSDDNFFTWFNSSADKNASFVRGSWDFVVHIATPSSRYLSMPEEKVALEIGHGGGRILAAASRHFKRVIGVDIHDHNQKVEDALKERGVDNFSLMKIDGKEIPVESNSVDLVYSFIVLQHVEKYDIFENYIKETFRVLKTDGIAILYFGRRSKLSINRGSKALYLVDRFMEGILLPNGFKELPARVNETNLLVSLSHAKSLARKTGFQILSGLVSHKQVPDGINLFGGQNGLVLRKR